MSFISIIKSNLTVPLAVMRFNVENAVQSILIT
ncbi:hypothetical protein J2125_004283 [Erwinia toletana]|uniref:Uncharacterized protein n=1 Tax=Winslowiella toletana TaxID=92490 RepID=A0ABS4PEN0_9GAMM|nr:hypothetical protein [Winslowiella toletana]